MAQRAFEQEIRRLQIIKGIVYHESGCRTRQLCRIVTDQYGDAVRTGTVAMPIG